jgi:hypothetical protein
MRSFRALDRRTPSLHFTFMAKLPPRIKVFRTRIGFHDWVVATSSQANALEAWDISRNLFATGEAEITNDPKDIDAALSNIGKPVALPKSASKTSAKAAPRAKQASASSDWPPDGLSKPAQRALANAKIASLKQLAAKRETDVAGLHGMGPNGIATLTRALKAAGLSFKK